MREILFKAKRIDNGEWVEGYLFFIVDTPYIICEGETMCMDGENTDLYATEWYEVDETTICQYTGLKDKNGNKIWENDVVKVNIHESNLVTTQMGATCSANIVEWESSSSYTIKYCPSDLMNLERWTNRTYITCEVIGNVFDNPELVGGAE